MKSPLKRLLLCAIASALALLTTSLQAETLLFHTAYIDPSSGKTPSNPWTDENGQSWNYIPTWTVWPASSRTYYNTSGEASSIAWKTTQRFAYFYTDGQASSALGYPDLVSQYGLYLSTTPVQGIAYTSAEIMLSGLDTQSSYNLTFYGARRTAASLSDKDASLAFSINGQEAGELFLAVGNNEAELFVQNITPDATGQVTIGVTLPSEYQWGFLNAVKVESIPEPTTLGWIGVGILIPFLFLRIR